jgi:hypothetical protein
MPRQAITVSVPEGLHKRLEPYRDRLNISQICQEALIARLDAIDAQRKDKRRMSVIERLRREKRELLDRDFNNGKEGFKRRLPHLSYGTIRRLANFNLELAYADPSDVMWRHITSVIETRGKDWEKEIGADDSEMWARGFIEAAQETLEEVDR